MFLNIIHLNDMCQPNGVDIYDQFISGEKKQFPRPTMSWPIQTNPSKSSWQLWNKQLKQHLEFKIITNYFLILL